MKKIGSTHLDAVPIVCPYNRQSYRYHFRLKFNKIVVKFIETFSGIA